MRLNEKISFVPLSPNVEQQCLTSTLTRLSQETELLDAGSLHNKNCGSTANSKHTKSATVPLGPGLLHNKL